MTWLGWTLVCIYKGWDWMWSSYVVYEIETMTIWLVVVWH